MSLTQKTQAQSFIYPIQLSSIEDTQQPKRIHHEGWLNRLFFDSAYEILKLAKTHVLTPQMIPDIPPEECCEQLHHRFSSLLSADNPQLSQALLSTFKKPLIYVFLTLLLATLAQLAIPVLIKYIILYISTGQQSIQEGIVLLVLVVSVRLINVLCTSHSRAMLRIIGNDAMSVVCMELLAKSMNVSFLSNKSKCCSQILNLMQVDAQKLLLVTTQLSGVALTPLQLGVAIVLMFYLIGVSFTAGLLVILLTAIINVFIGRIQITNQRQLMQAKDARTQRTNEIFSQIKFIKINALEEYFKSRLLELRAREVITLDARLKVQAWGILSVWMSPQMILAATFALYAYMGNQLSAASTFATISLFQTLQQPLLQLPIAINALLETNISLKRLQEFFTTQELQLDCIFKNTSQSNDEVAIAIVNGQLHWQKGQQELNVQLKVNAGQFICILGDVGSGKSSLLQALLGEMKYSDDQPPTIQVNGSIAYVSQKPWIQNATVRDNILFGRPFEQRKYDEALKYSCLSDDIVILSNGDQTMIGEKGINLSGGQKARVSLARALYSDADIYLLDDPISAVDVHVGKFIINKCLNGYLKGKTRVLVTHAINFCSYTNYIYIMENGEIKEQGTYSEIKETKQFQAISQKFYNQEESDDQQAEYYNSLSLEQSLKSAPKHMQQPEKDEVEDLMTLEERTVGNISGDIIQQYFRFNGGMCAFAFVAVVMIFWVSCYIGASLWMVYWTNQPYSEQQDNMDYYILVFVMLGVGQGVLAFIRAWTIIVQSIKSADAIHTKMIECLMYAPQCSFFERVPLGRIMNRFTKDQNVLDAEIFWHISWLYTKFGQLIANTFLNIYASTYYIILPILLYFYSSLSIQRIYMQASRELYRLELITKSPILSAFTEMVNGLPTIRAFDKQYYNLRIFAMKQDINRKIVGVQVNANAWFIQMLGLTSFIVNVSAIGYCIFWNTGNAALAGLLMTYASQLDANISQTVEALGALENGIISFERCVAYTQVKPEIGHDSNKQTIEMWPSKGTIEFLNVTICYRAGLQAALKNMSIVIPSNTKLGVVGRTGAGKSTITLAILRILETSQGSISIDGIKITDVTLTQLRESVTMIMQDATIFDGTVRANLDPQGIRSDDEILQALSECCLSELVNNQSGLDTHLTEGGDNLSAGEKQLLCIARAVLKKSKIILIDEATANIDVETEYQIQNTIKKAFKNCTVITIAHRINTILHCDKILVVDKGFIKEYGDTKTLINDKTSTFHQIYQEALRQSRRK